MGGLRLGCSELAGFRFTAQGEEQRGRGRFRGVLIYSALIAPVSGARRATRSSTNIGNCQTFRNKDSTNILTIEFENSALTAKITTAGTFCSRSTGTSSRVNSSDPADL